MVKLFNCCLQDTVKGSHRIVQIIAHNTDQAAGIFVAHHFDNYKTCPDQFWVERCNIDELKKELNAPLLDVLSEGFLGVVHFDAEGRALLAAIPFVPELPIYFVRDDPKSSLGG